MPDEKPQLRVDKKSIKRDDGDVKLRAKYGNLDLEITIFDAEPDKPEKAEK